MCKVTSFPDNTQQKQSFFSKSTKLFHQYRPISTSLSNKGTHNSSFPPNFAQLFFIFLTPLPSSISPQPSPCLTLPSLFPSPSQALPKLKQLG